MPNIFKNKILSIDKKNSKIILTIPQNIDYPPIEFLISNQIIYLYKTENNILKYYFNTTNLYNFKSFLDSRKSILTYNDSIQIFYNLTTQIQFYKNKFNKTIDFFHPDFIILIGLDFLFLPNLFYDIKGSDDKKYITINNPIKKNIYMSPELLNITTIPSNIHYKTSYFSLASFISNHLTKHNNYIYPKNIKQIIKLIKDTPLYFALIRCFNINPKYRFLLLI